MITLDTSALVALADPDDANHEDAITALSVDPGPPIIPIGILAEVTYMLEVRVGPVPVDRFLADLRAGAFELDCGERALGRVRALIGQYADLPLGFADASVIACAERHRGRVLSFDRDFAVVAREGTISVHPSA